MSMENITHKVGCYRWIKIYKPPPTALLLYFGAYITAIVCGFVCSSKVSLPIQYKFVSIFHRQCQQFNEIVETKEKMPNKKNTSSQNSATETKESRPRGRPRRNAKPSTKLDEFETNICLDTSLPKRSVSGPTQAKQRKTQACNEIPKQQSTLDDSTGDVLMINSTKLDATLKKGKGTNGHSHSKDRSFVPSEEESSLASLVLSIQDYDSEIEDPDQRKKKQLPVNRATRKRKLRPDDERTLKLLTEKFRNSQNGVVCQIPACKSKPMKSTKPSNLKRHISQVHPKVYAALFPHEVSAKKRAELEAFNAVQDAIELVTVNGHAFSVLSASGMKGYIKSRVEAIRTEGGIFDNPINRLSIVKLVAEESQLVKERIAEELKGKTISIMFDVCTNATLSMLCVQAVYMKGSQVVCRTLGVIQIEVRHTSVNLANMVFDILAEFDVNLPKVLSITTDTAKNATATTNVLNLVVSNSEKSIDNNIAEESFFDIDSDEEDDGLEFGLDIENEAELQKVIDNVAAQTLLVKEMVESIGRENNSIVVINQINCGTHVFQLAANGALEESNSTDTIGIVHDMCILMRTQIVMIELRKLGSKVILPPLDNATRWNSKFTMCRDFLKMKDIVIRLAENAEFGYKFENNELFWRKVEEIVEVLSSSYDLTIEMQGVGYGLASLYIGWLRVQKRLQRIVKKQPMFDLAQKLIDNMEQRAKSLFKSPLFLCSVYLDPRINFKLTDEQRASAAMCLVKIFEREMASQLIANKENRINDTLDEIQDEYHSQQNEEQSSTNRLLKEMSVYETETPFDIKAEVMQFWTEKSHIYPVLRPLADLLHAVPSNQCRTEAAFSSLSYIRNRYRMSMQSKNISNILMVRLNKDIYYELREERIQKILG